MDGFRFSRKPFLAKKGLVFFAVSRLLMHYGKMQGNRGCKPLQA